MSRQVEGRVEHLLRPLDAHRRADLDGPQHDREHERARRYTQALVDASLAALRARPQPPADDAHAMRSRWRTQPASSWLDGIVNPELLER